MTSRLNKLVPALTFCQLWGPRFSPAGHRVPVAVVGAAAWRLAPRGDVPRAERVGLLMTAVHARDKGRNRERTLAK